MDRLKGEVKTVTFRDLESGYCVLKTIPENKKAYGNQVTIVGILPGLATGDEVEFYGNFGKHKRFGRQFEAGSYQIILPTSLDGLQTYLKSHIKGIGPVFARKIVEKFSENTTKILEKNPEKLAKIKGITKNKAIEIGKEWQKDAAVRSQLIKLSSLSISPKLALKIISKYKDDSYKTIKDNPYQLAEDIWGVGFIKADQIARKLGFKQDNPQRIAAGVEYILSKALENGHLFLPQNELIEQTSKLTSANSKNINQVICSLIRQKRLVQDKENAIYLSLYFHTEKSVSEMIQTHQKRQKENSPSNLDKIDLTKGLDLIKEKQNLSLHIGQKRAVKIALTNPISILTGGPGTGKSTTLKALVSILKAKKKTVALAAPTGRAAKRITEITGQEAKTIHRLLKLDRTGNAYYNQDNPLPIDFLIVDEVSMLDILLAYKLFSAIGVKTHLLLVGDDNQLPSVQAGNLLADLIQSNTIPVIKLTHIFRQARDSAIVLNAHKINAGFFPFLPKHPTDFYFFKEEDPEAATNLIVDLVYRRIPTKFNFDPMSDIQVLAPMHKTACGVEILNKQLQQTLNPKIELQTQISFGSRIFRVNDRVMQLINNYEKEVFNGEIGKIKTIKQDDGNCEVEIEFDGRTVKYQQDELKQITLAYALSVHKSQGSEYPVVVMPILTTHYIMLARNLLYTAITRAKKLVVLVGSKKALAIAVKNNKAAKRYTLLADRLRELTIR